MESIPCCTHQFCKGAQARKTATVGSLRMPASRLSTCCEHVEQCSQHTEHAQMPSGAARPVLHWEIQALKGSWRFSPFPYLSGHCDATSGHLMTLKAVQGKLKISLLGQLTGCEMQADKRSAMLPAFQSLEQQHALASCMSKWSMVSTKS